MRSILIPAVLALLLAACNREPAPQAEAAAPTSAAAAPSCALTLGWDPYEPYQFADQDGQLRGLDAELVAAMANAAGCSLSTTRGDWSSLLKGLQGGNVDLLAGATITPEREKFARFGKPYRSESFVLFVRRGEAANWSGDSLETLLREKKMRIGLIDGYAYGDTVDALLGQQDYDKQFISASFSESHAANLLENAIDGLLEDPFVGAAMIRRKNLGEQIEALPFSLPSNEVALMFSSATVSPEIVARFDAAAEQLRASGEFEKIVQRWRN